MSLTTQLDERWTLVAPHRDRLLHLLLSRCNSKQDAEDCAHEAMLRVATFDRLDPERASQMLTTVALRLAVDEHRRPLRRRRALRRLFASTAAQSPEDVALDRITAVQALDHAEQLGTQERSVLMLRAQGVGAAEAATELGVSYKSCESAYTRARRKLRAAVAAPVALLALAVRHVLSGSSTAQAMVMAAIAVAAVSVPGHSTATPRGGTPVSTFDLRLVAGHLQAENGARTSSSAASPHAAMPLRHGGAGTGSLPVDGHRGGTSDVANVNVHTAVVATPVRVQQQDANQSLTQSLAQCTNEGVSLDPSHLGCRP